MLKDLLQQGATAFSAGQFADARDAFADAVTIAPVNVTANRGLGYSYLKLDKPALALDPLEKLATLVPMDRSLTLSLSASLVAAHNPARAMKFLKGYLLAHQDPVDEPVLNALGTALSQVQPPATQGVLFLDSQKLYDTLNQKLEQTEPDKKRWGIDWLPSAEVDQKQHDLDDARAKAQAASSKLQIANAMVSAAKQSLNSASETDENREARVARAQQRLDEATDKQKAAQADNDDASTAVAGLPAPSFPDQISLDTVDFSLTGPAVVAAANPPAPPENPAPGDALPVAPPPADSPVAAPQTAPADTPDQPVDHSTRYAVAFAIAPDILVTAASQVENSTDIEVTTRDGKNLKAKILRDHHSDGIALLQVDGAKFPCLAIAALFKPDSTSSLDCLSFPDVDLFNPIPKSMPVTAPVPGDNWLVHFDDSPRLPGGPLLKAGAVVGVELGDRDSDLGAVPAATLKSLQSLVASSADANPPATDPTQAVVQITADH